MKKFALVIASTVLIVMCTVYSRAAAQGVYEALCLCARSLIPSLFPMLFAAVFIAENGSSKLIGKWMQPVMKKIFGLPGEAGTAFVAAITGGYPAGASAIASLYNNGILSEKQAEKAAYFCVCAGPGFLIGAVGSAMLGSIGTGVLLLAVQVSSVIISGVLLRFTVKSKESDICSHIIVERKNNIAQALTVSVRSACESMLMICAYVLLAGALSGMLEQSGVSGAALDFFCLLGMDKQNAAALIPSLIEVGSGCARARFAGVPMIAFAVGFGGFAVHFQIYSILSKIKISPLLFTAVRLICGLYCSAATKLLLPLLASDAIATSATYTPQLAQRNVPGSVALIVMCLMSVLCIPKIRCKNDA